MNACRPMRPVLELDKVSFHTKEAPLHKAIWLIDRVSLDIKQGQILTLVGRNGAGKTSLIRMMAGLKQPHDGEVLLNGLPMTSYSSCLLYTSDAADD